MIFSFTFIEAHSQRSGINWGDICRNPVVDMLISEPCNTLTTNGGYQLTAEGERVIACIAGGGALMLVDPTGQALAAAKLLGSSVRCGGSPHQYSNNDNEDPISGLVSGILGSQNSRGNSYSDNQNPLGNIIAGLFGNN